MFNFTKKNEDISGVDWFKALNLTLCDIEGLQYMLDSKPSERDIFDSAGHLLIHEGSAYVIPSDWNSYIVFPPSTPERTRENVLLAMKAINSAQQGKGKHMEINVDQTQLNIAAAKIQGIKLELDDFLNFARTVVDGFDSEVEEILTESFNLVVSGEQLLAGGDFNVLIGDFIQMKLN